MNEDRELTTGFSLQDVEILETEECYSGFLKISRMQLRHRLYAGGWSNTMQRELVQRVPGVGVLLYDSELDMVLLVEQFRAGCLQPPLHSQHSQQSPWKLELAAGLIDTDETPEQVAVREVKEEAGVEIGSLFPICNYFLSPGSSTEYMTLFYAGFDASLYDCYEVGKIAGGFGLDEENEDIRPVVMSRQVAEKAIGDGIIDNAMSIIALQWLKLNLESVRKKLAGKESGL